MLHDTLTKPLPRLAGGQGRMTTKARLGHWWEPPTPEQLQASPVRRSEPGVTSDTGRGLKGEALRVITTRETLRLSKGLFKREESKKESFKKNAPARTSARVLYTMPSPRPPGELRAEWTLVFEA